MTKYIFSLLSLTLFLVCCVEKPRTNVDLLVFNSRQFKKIDKIECNHTDYIDSCVFIPLETTGESLISEVTQLEMFDEKYYIFDIKTKKMKVFDRSGRFLHDIGKLGKGRGEYVSINAFCLNRKEKKIGIFDPLKNAVHEYTLSGKYLQTIRHNHREFSGIEKVVYTDTHLYCFSKIDFSKHNTAFVVLSPQDYSVIDRIQPYPVKPSEDMFVSLMNHPYSLVNGAFHYVSLFSDTIYTYDNGREIPYLYIETGNPNISSSYLKNQEIENEPIIAFTRVWQDRNYSPGFTELGETDRFVLANFKLNNFFYFLDKKKNEGFYVETGTTPDLTLPSLVNGNTLVVVWTPDDIEVFQDMIKKKELVECPESVKIILENYDSEYHNPILAVYYMKD